jgi:hypothetical protein
MTRRATLLATALAVAAVAPHGRAVHGQTPDPITHIREADLKRDLFALAGDETRGREGGTLAIPVAVQVTQGVRP